MINWALIAQIAAAVSGAVGTILTPIYGSKLTTAVQALLQALSGLLMVIPTITSHQVVTAKAKARLAQMTANNKPI